MSGVFCFPNLARDNEGVWPFKKPTPRVRNPDAWVAIVDCERHLERLIEVNLERQGRNCRNLGSIDELLATKGMKPFAVVVDALGQELADIKRQITSQPGWEKVMVLSLTRREGNGPSDWPDFNFTGAAAVITPFDR